MLFVVEEFVMRHSVIERSGPVFSDRQLCDLFTNLLQMVVARVLPFLDRPEDQCVPRPKRISCVIPKRQLFHLDCERVQRAKIMLCSLPHRSRLVVNLTTFCNAL